MARRMNAFSFLRAACLAMLMTGVAAAHSQTLRDPTRPPGASSIKGGPGVALDSLVLQSILISPERKVAVISGKLVTPGESVEGYMLVAIAENEAVLKNGDKVRRLHLYPSVDMQRQKEFKGGTSGVRSGPGNGQ